MSILYNKKNWFTSTPLFLRRRKIRFGRYACFILVLWFIYIRRGLSKQQEQLEEQPLWPLDNVKNFPDYKQCQDLKYDVDTLPDLVHTSFEEATEDVVLQGWEDEWLSEAQYDPRRWGKIEEPKIDFIYTWVNGSEKAFQETRLPYELNSTLNYEDADWFKTYRLNRYREWDELRYSLRSVERLAKSFRNKIQILVNSVGQEEVAASATPEMPAKIVGKQWPLWLKDNLNGEVEVLAQEDFFAKAEQGCLPAFNSLTIESQMYNTESTVDQFFAMSNDMLLGKPHAASDIYNPLFGPTMSFQQVQYDTKYPPTDLEEKRIYEVPHRIYTSWLLNRRFGERRRNVTTHLGHSLSRSVMRETLRSFPRPAAESATQRFRKEMGLQIISWFLTFHYMIERHREALLWSYIMLRSDKDNSGNLEFEEREAILADLEEGMAREGTDVREQMYLRVPELTKTAGLKVPKVNLDVLWTSLDGPAAIRDIECLEFDVDECLAPGFSTHSSDLHNTNPVFSTASIFDRLARQNPTCGDCLLKLLLNRSAKGLSPLLPRADTQSAERAVVIKALIRYQYTIVESDAVFVMVQSAQQVWRLRDRFKEKHMVGQLCLNDDLMTDDDEVVEGVRKAMLELFNVLEPEPSRFEKIHN